jgi:glycosyltransferase involved in cell wall biosynthesis
VSDPEVTVLTAVRNGEPHLASTIRSIIAQTFSDWEYIVVDDASADASAETVERFSRADERVKLVRRKESGGPFAAANTGIRVARGRYLIRTDADDISPPYRIERQLAFLQGNPPLRACISPWQAFDSSGMISGSLAQIPLRPRSLRWYLLLRAFSAHSSLCIEKDSLVALGCYRELPVAQDYRLISELSRRDWIGVMPDVMVFYRNHLSRISKKRGEDQISLAIEVMREHLSDIADDDWTESDLRDLWLAGHGKRGPVTRGLRAIGRWSRMWKADPTLDEFDRRELAYLEWLHTWRFARANARSELLASFLGFGARVASDPWCAATGIRHKRTHLRMLKGVPAEIAGLGDA